VTTTITFTPRKAPVVPGTWGGQSFMAGTWNGDGFDIRFRYDPDLVTLIKDVIPGNARRWDQTDKCWSADVFWSKQFAQVCKQKGYTVVGLAAAQMPKLPPPPPAPVISWADILLARCGTPELRQAVYRNLAKALHADVGGDGTLMQELNDARKQYDRQEGTA
jgi:hypothetical protein